MLTLFQPSGSLWMFFPTLPSLLRKKRHTRHCLFLARQPQWAKASSFTRFLDHIKRHTGVGRTSLDE